MFEIFIKITEKYIYLDYKNSNGTFQRTYQADFNIYMEERANKSLFLGKGPRTAKTLLKENKVGAFIMWYYNHDTLTLMGDRKTSQGYV